jgi:hypothetical protein
VTEPYVLMAHAAVLGLQVVVAAKTLWALDQMRQAQQPPHPSDKPGWPFPRPPGPTPARSALARAMGGYQPVVPQAVAERRTQPPPRNP